MKLNFSLSTKLFINNVFYAVPIMVLLTLMFNSYNKDLLFGEKEVLGNDIQRTTMELVSMIERNKRYTPEMDELTKNILTKMKSFEGDLLLDNGSLHDRKRDQINYETLTATFKNFKDNKADPYKVLKDLRELIIHTGDTSNLILDPDLDSYYLMDVTLIAAPQMTDRFYEVDDYMKQLAQKPEEALSLDEEVKLSVYIAMLKESDWGRIYADIGTALNEDKNFYGTNSKLQSTVKTQADNLDAQFKILFATMEQIKKEKKKVLEVSTLLDKIAVDSQKFYLTTNETLTDLLNTRDNATIATRNRSMIIGAAAIFIALLVSVLTSINFKNGSKRISQALRMLMGAVETNAEASEKLTESSSSLSSISSQQASAVQQTVSSLHQINAMSEKNFDSIKYSFEKTIEGKSQALHGKESIHKMASTIKEISISNQQFFDEINASNEELRIILSIITDISERTKVINDIVFQTRILSFNASVEAARAGEHGKGFAIVAEEIGKLAQVSGNSAKEINDILGKATTQVENIIHKMNARVSELTLKAKAQLDSGEQIANECVESLNTIVENVSELSMMMNDISHAITEQSKGYAEITKSIDQIDQGVHHGLELSRETSSHAEKLHDQAGELKKIVITIEKEVLGTEKTA